uniref:Uncharacterized protein n=1 Tax=Homalodisca liturata TaxID=320908 RepID=A0A1B6JYH2_9HEMI
MTENVKFNHPITSNISQYTFENTTALIRLKIPLREKSPQSFLHSYHPGRYMGEKMIELAHVVFLACKAYSYKTFYQVLHDRFYCSYKLHCDEPWFNINVECYA